MNVADVQPTPGSPASFPLVDANAGDAGWVGLYTPHADIKFNVYYMDNKDYNDEMDKNVALHEMGHALGLNHSCDKNVMFARVTEQTKFGPIDNSAYKAAWG
ncbi:matrixin family metalloprotease [Nocardia sp. NPDC051570]|uniref:matrixin family metalloprotease n=1 Tax=Nocardia sp. NPDC051570 TaxID=3364324 RepID=UPI0037B8DC01